MLADGAQIWYDGIIFQNGISCCKLMVNGLQASSNRASYTLRTGRGRCCQNICGFFLPDPPRSKLIILVPDSRPPAAAVIGRHRRAVPKLIATPRGSHGFCGLSRVEGRRSCCILCASALSWPGDSHDGILRGKHQIEGLKVD